MKTIKIEIFDDGQKPTTCSRNILNKESCKMLLLTKFGTRFQCRLFSESFGGISDCLKIDGKSGFIIPHEQCLIARINED